MLLLLIGMVSSAEYFIYYAEKEKESTQNRRIQICSPDLLVGPVVSSNTQLIVCHGPQGFIVKEDK